MHLPGESIVAMFQRFTVIMNNMRANVVVLPSMIMTGLSSSCTLWIVPCGVRTSRPFMSWRSMRPCVRCQVPNGPRGLLGLGLRIRSSPCLGSSNPIYLKRGEVSIKSSKRLEGKPFSLAGRGRSPAANVPCALPTLAALFQPSTREQYP
jgi:hypothetical protein